MKRIIVLGILVLLNYSCNSGDDVCCTVISLDIDIKFEDSVGTNLINAGGGINESNITVYHKINNEWRGAFNQSLLVRRNNEPYLRFFLSEETDENNISETQIAFSLNETDTVKAELNKTPNTVTINKIWYNGVLKWNTDQPSERYFTITK